MTQAQWIPITTARPPIGQQVLFCCLIDRDFSDVDCGEYQGEKTDGNAVVMDRVGDDWAPCSHWMPLPEPPSVWQPKTCCNTTYAQESDYQAHMRLCHPRGNTETTIRAADVQASTPEK